MIEMPKFKQLNQHMHHMWYLWVLVSLKEKLQHFNE